MNNRKKVVTMLAVVMVTCVAGFWSYNNFVKTQETNMYVEQNDYKILKDKFQQLNVKNQQMEESLNKPRSLGYKSIKTSQLNIRQDASVNLEPVGVFVQNNIINVVDTSNPLWYKIDINLSGLTATDKKDNLGRVLFTNSTGKDVCYINPKFIKDGNLTLGGQYYLNSNYLSESSEQYIFTATPQNPQKPFVYGILFYDSQFGKTLESELWKNLSSVLIQKGFDGIKVEYADRNKVVDKMKNNYYQVVETPPIELSRATIDNNNYIPFLKLVNKANESSEYTGVIIADKNSNIKTPSDLKGKKICFTDTSSASGYLIQKFYLKNKYKIDIDKDCTIVTKKEIYKDAENDKFQHDEIPLVVAKGYVDAGFCGDFVLTTEGYGNFKNYLNNKLLPYSVVGIDNDEKLKKYFDGTVKILNFVGENPLTNNAHSMTKELYKDDTFVNQLKSAVSNTYKLYNEEFGITDADKGEYGFAKELVTFQRK